MNSLELLEQGRGLAEEFILWLWWRSLVDGGASGSDEDGSACFLEDSIVLASERGDVKQISLQKGNPCESREAFEALARGMRPTRTKLRILSGDLEWVFTLDATTLTLRSLKLPKVSSREPQAILQDRAFLLEEAYGHLDQRLTNFLAARHRAPEEMLEAMRGWVQAGLQGELEFTREGEAQPE